MTSITAGISFPNRACQQAGRFPGQKALGFLLAVLLLAGLCSGASAQFAGGAGTAENPYRVATRLQLNQVRSYLGAYFRQTADIDLGVEPYNQGEGWVPIGSPVAGLQFTGSYDGAGHVIRNLIVNRPGQDYQGLFGYAVGASIANLRLENATVTGQRYVGGLIGYADGGQLKAISLSGKITGLADTGGLVGAARSTLIRKVETRGSVHGETNVGGLAGKLGAPLTNPDPYAPGVPAPATTEPESNSATSPDGAAVTVRLTDGTSVSIPQLPGPYQVSVVRSSNDLPIVATLLQGTNLTASGALRQVTITAEEGSDALKPVITIPAREIGTILPDTVQVLRVGTVVVNGELVENHAFLLPVSTDADGNLVFVDPLIPYGTLPAPEAVSSARAPTSTVQSDSQTFVGEVRYVLVTIDSTLDWSSSPRLVRMLPGLEMADAGYRREATSADRTKLAKQPICNLIVLIHGHNEYEKAGFEPATAAAPWLINYKRLVWELLYKTFLQGKDYPLKCTAFYEFIFPTYRPIFSPVLDRSGWRYRTLGEDLGQLLNEEIKTNPQLKAMVDNSMPFNLFVTAHSQGGLVARAGLRHLSEGVLKNLQGFVSWGSPHRGGALVTLRYVLSAGHDLIWQGVKLPLQNIGVTAAYQNAINGIVLDTPGTRDLRWDASRKDMLRLDDDSLFRENSSSITLPPDRELPGGTLFFSDNLAKFNATEGDWIGERLRDKYILLRGTTSKRAQVETVGSSWAPWASTLWRFNNSTEIQQGAFLNERLMKDPYTPSDGAVPVFSQEGGGLGAKVEGIKRVNLGDVDHEEFYGAETPQRNAATIAIGETVAQRTFTELGLGTADSRGCPTIEYQVGKEGAKTVFTGRLVFPLYDVAQGGDGKVGNRVDRIEARAGSGEGEVIDTLAFTHEDDGTFRGEGLTADLPNDEIVLVAVLKDASEVLYTPTPVIESVSCDYAPPDARIYIRGKRFGATQGNSTVTLNGAPLTSISGWADYGIRLLLPGNASSGNVVVTVAGVKSNAYPYVIDTQFSSKLAERPNKSLYIEASPPAWCLVANPTGSAPIDMYYVASNDPGLSISQTSAGRISGSYHKVQSYGSTVQCSRTTDISFEDLPLSAWCTCYTNCDSLLGCQAEYCADPPTFAYADRRKPKNKIVYQWSYTCDDGSSGSFNSDACIYNNYSIEANAVFSKE